MTFKKPKPYRTYYLVGRVERVCPDNRGRPSYKWFDGYAESWDQYPRLTYREARQEAKRDGVRAVFKKQKED